MFNALTKLILVIILISAVVIAPLQVIAGAVVVIALCKLFA